MGTPVEVPGIVANQWGIASPSTNTPLLVSMDVNKIHLDGTYIKRELSQTLQRPFISLPLSRKHWVPSEDQQYRGRL